MSRPLHRSKQNIPFNQRKHLHDGLRLMTPDIPKHYGWHLPRVAVNRFEADTDTLEEKLYQAHESAHRMGEKLKRAKHEVEQEYERTGKVLNLSFERFLAQSNSIVVEVYKNRQEGTARALELVQTVLTHCNDATVELKKRIQALQKQHGKKGMHCRLLLEADYSSLDARIKSEIRPEDSSHVVIPCSNTEDWVYMRNTSDLTNCDVLEALVDRGASCLVAIDCPVDILSVAGCITLKENPSFPRKLDTETLRRGECLKTIFLARNGLGSYGLEVIANGMNTQGQLQILHYMDNFAGELNFHGLNRDMEYQNCLKAFRMLGDVVRHSNSLLRVLNLSKNRIGSAGCSLLAAGLATSKTLKVFDLSDNELGLAGANQIAKALAGNNSLEILNLNRTQIGLAGFRNICSALSLNATLQQLHVLGSSGLSGLNSAVQCLDENSTLFCIHVFETKYWWNPRCKQPTNDLSHLATEVQNTTEFDLLELTDEISSISGSIDSSLPMEPLRDSAATAQADRAVSKGSNELVRDMDLAGRFSLSFREGRSEKQEAPEATSDFDISMQLQQMHDRVKEARESTRGLMSFGAAERLIHNKRARELAQSWGPELQIGMFMPTSAQIIGFKAGGIDKLHISCEWCLHSGKRAGIGVQGHEDFECPFNFYEATGELMPGFDSFGSKVEDMWEQAGTEPTEEVLEEWKELKGLGFFLESADNPPVVQRKIPLPDRNSKGQLRNLWSEKGSYATPDNLLRRRRFEQLTDGKKFNLLSTLSDIDDPFIPSEQASSSPFTRKSILSSDGARSKARNKKSVLFAGEGPSAGQNGSEMPATRNTAASLPKVLMASDGYIPSVKKRNAAFLQSIQQNKFEEVKAFLSQIHGEIAADLQDRFGNSGLLIAVKNGYKRITKLLLKAGASVNRQNQMGNTALHYAHSMNHTAILAYLEASGADDTITNEQGQTCYQYKSS